MHNNTVGSFCSMISGLLILNFNIVNSTFTDHSSYLPKDKTVQSGYSGMMLANTLNVHIEGSTFTNNKIKNSGGINIKINRIYSYPIFFFFFFLVIFMFMFEEIRVTNCVFHNNSAASNGGVF